MSKERVRFVKYTLDNEGIFKIGKIYEVQPLDEWGFYWTEVNGMLVRMNEDEVEVVGPDAVDEAVLDVTEMIQFIWEQLEDAAETAETNPIEDYEVGEKLRLAQKYLIKLEEEL